MVPSSDFWFNTIVGGAVGAVLGGLIGSVIDNWTELRTSYRYSALWLQFTWEYWVTREWASLAPLLVESNKDAQGTPAANPPTISCPVCHGLAYDTPHREQSPGEWKLRPGAGFDLLIDGSRCPYPRTSDWVTSATQGCVSCQIVVDAVSAYSPGIFSDYTLQSDDLGLGSTHIRAIANQGKPLSVAICKPSIPWQSEREEYLEVLTGLGMCHHQRPYTFGC
jgi:hypothetical protein